MHTMATPHTHLSFISTIIPTIPKTLILRRHHHHQPPPPPPPPSQSKLFVQTLNSQITRGGRLICLSSNDKQSETKEQIWVTEGVVTESLPNGMFRVLLDNQSLVLGHISGKIRKSFIRIQPGDRVRIEISRYDSTRGRIVYRLRNRDSN